MSEPQKVSRCKFCSAEITWTTDPVTGKNYPKNLNGTPHLCQSQQKPAPVEKTPAQLAQEREEYNRKAAAAGFQTGAEVKQQQGEKKDCTSSNTPAAPGIKTVEGQIVLLDKPAHKITIKTRDGQQHSFIWAPAMDAEFSKLSQWWFTKVTGEHEADVDLWRATAQGFFKRPDDWPFAKGGQSGGGRPFQPRNEKIIVMQTALKVAADVMIARGFCEGNDPAYADQMKEITEEAIKAAEALCKAAGV